MVNECRKMQIHVCMNTGWPERIDTYLKIVLTCRTAGERLFSWWKSSEIRFYLVCLIHLWPPCRKSLLLRQIVCMERWWSDIFQLVSNEIWHFDLFCNAGISIHFCCAHCRMQKTAGVEKSPELKYTSYKDCIVS